MDATGAARRLRDDRAPYLIHRGEQFAACSRASATNLSADAAVVVVGRVAITLLGASATCDDTGLERGAYDAEIGLGLTGHDPARRIAHVGAVKVEPNAPHQLGHVRLAEAGVGAAGARGGTVEAVVDAVQQELAIKSDRPRMPLDDFSDCHFPSVTRWHLSSSRRASALRRAPPGPCAPEEGLGRGRAQPAPLLTRHVTRDRGLHQDHGVALELLGDRWAGGHVASASGRPANSGASARGTASPVS